MRLETYLRAAAARLAEAETPLLDARVIAQHVLGLDHAGLILAGDRSLTAEEITALDALFARRARGESVAHIVGEKEFYGLTFKLAPGVLAPRPDTETLIEAAVALRNTSAPLRILDLGTGTGCLLCALLTAFPRATGLGVDINPDAARLACDNASALGLSARASFLVADWAKPISGRFDVIVSNPPYIRESDLAGLSREVRLFEDRRALVAGPDGLSDYRTILAAAPALLSPEGLTILELGAGQDGDISAIAKDAFPDAGLLIGHDLAGRARALVIDLSQEKSV